MNEGGKSDSPLVPVKPPNNAASAVAEVVEVVEGRGLAEIESRAVVGFRG